MSVEPQTSHVNPPAAHGKLLCFETDNSTWADILAVGSLYLLGEDKETTQQSARILYKTKGKMNDRKMQDHVNAFGHVIQLCLDMHPNHLQWLVSEDCGDTPFAQFLRLIKSKNTTNEFEMFTQNGMIVVKLCFAEDVAANDAAWEAEHKATADEDPMAMD
jgi:hypothetical protein